MEPKWQRIRFMPATPLGADGARVTGCEAHIALSRRAATEGMVLLKNENETLPLKHGTRVAVFGKAQADYVKGGGGSGDTTVAYVRSLAQGLRIKQGEGKIEVFEPLERFYAENVSAQFAAGATPGKTREPILSDELVKQARAFTDTAILTICRFSGEDYDRTGQPHDGDYFLSFEEEHMVKKVLAAFPRVAVVLNTGGMMDTLWFRDNPAVGAALLAWQGGMEGGLAAADILVGDVCPSGHLTDTFASSFAAYPSSANFAESRLYVEYQEDVFVGYRYFETIPGAAASVCYPFGYGLSYTTFALSDVRGGMNGAGEIALSATVTNTGLCAGKYVLQAYVNPPKGRIAKPAAALVGFAKTRLLEPNESETLTVSFAPYAFATYDDEGAVRKSAYVLEKGAYGFRVGENVRETVNVDYRYELDDDAILEQLSPKCAPTLLHRRMLADGSYREIACAPETPRKDWRKLEGIPDEGQYPLENPDQIPGCAWIPPMKPQLIEVAEGDLTLDEFMSLLSDEDMARLLGGQPNRGVANTFGFGNLPTDGVPNVMTADGPAGLRIKPECGVTTTAFPCATLLACTWNTEIVREIGAAGAREVVAPVNGPERGVEGRLDAVFESHVAVAGQGCEPVEFALVDAVGARADDDPRDVGMREGFIVKRLQPLQRGIGVGKGLEIDQVTPRRAVTVAVKLDALGDLLPDALRGHAIRRGERSVVTERTPSFADRPVAVGAREARINGKFLHPAAEQTAEVPRIGVEPPRIAPRVDHRYKPQSEGL